MGNGAKIAIISIVSSIFFFSLTFFLIGFFKPKPGAVLVEANTASDVFVNGSLVGETPFEGAYEKGTINLKLVPKNTASGISPFETRVAVLSGVKTVVRRDFGETEDASGNYMISFEKDKEKGTGLIVVTYPENSEILIDGSPEGFSPFKSESLTDGEHKLVVKLEGYEEKAVDLSLTQGFRINVFVKLAKLKSVSEEVAGTKTEVKQFVEILETSTGFLRVRSEPGSGGREIHQVAPGEKYPFIEEDGETGWFKIQIEEPKAGLPDGRTGWVSNEFAKIVEEEAVSTPSTKLSD